MRNDSNRRRAALAVAAVGFICSFQAAAVEPQPEDAAQLINEVRRQVAACGGSVRASVQREEAGAGAVPSRPTLVWNAQLAAAAEQHSRAMAEQAFFDHVGRDGRRVAQRADAAGYRWRTIGENLAAGHRTLQDAVGGWLRSEGHCRNLLDARFPVFDLARVVSDRPNDRFRVYSTLVLRPQAMPVLQTASAD